MTDTLITRWILQVDQDDKVILKRRLVPRSNPINYLIEEDGDYHYSTVSLHNQHFSVVYKEQEKHQIKSIIYVGKIRFEDDQQEVLDLTEEDEKYIEALADFFLRKDRSKMH